MADDFFNGDPFDSIISQFFGDSPLQRRRRNTVIRDEEDERNIDFVETKNKIFVIFEIPGFNEKDILITVKSRELEIIAKKSGREMQNYLVQKLNQGISIKRILPNFVNTKRFSHTIKNGVLEVTFDKK
jgi:HSP20 family molecular chaperone IbpA